MLGPVIVNGCNRTQTRTYTASDGCQNSSTCTQVFTWKVTTPLVLTCPADLTTAACLSQADVNTAYNDWLNAATVTGGCNAVIMTNSFGAPARCGGSRIVTFTANGDCQSTGTCTATFTVPDPPNVVLNCPINTTVASCQSQAAINAQFSAWLNSASGTGGCGGMLTNDNIGAPSICGGNTVVTFTYTSNCFPFTTTCTATFTVAAPPTVQLICPPAMTVSPCLTQAQLNTQYAAWLA